MFVASSTNVSRNPKTAQAVRTQIEKEVRRRRDERQAKELEEMSAEIAFKRRIKLEEKQRQTLLLAERERVRRIEQYRRERELKLVKPLEVAASVDERLRCLHTLEYIARCVCWFYGVSLRELRSNRRDGKLCLARHAFFYWCKHLTPHSFPQIARFLQKDHTTALHSVRVYEKRKAQTKGAKQRA